MCNSSDTNMIDSGQTWIGNIPKKWGLSKIASLYSLRNEKVSDKDYPPLSVTMKGIVPQLETVAKTDDGDNRKLVKKGDFAINSRSDRRGSCGISDYDGSVSLINTVLTPRGKIHPGYYDWLFHTVSFADEYYKWGHGIVDDLWTTRWQEMKRIIVPVPSMDEQEKIARYLDETCTDIQFIIDESKKTIDEYQAWKAATIFECVTKGLNINEDQRESEVEWIGKIAAKWSLRVLFQIVTQVKCKNTDLIEQNLLSLSYGKIKRKDINTTDGLLPTSFDGYNIIECGDIVLRLTDLQNDHTSLRVGRARERGIVTSAYTTIRPMNGVDSEFLYYVLHAFDIKKGFYGMGSGVRQSLNYDEVKMIKIPYPPETELKKIVVFLNERCDGIDSIIRDKQNLISDLEFYKKSIVFETVTGKRKVV